MSSWTMIRLVTAREIRERGRSRTYLLSSLFTVLVVVGVILLPTILDGGDTYTVGLVGTAGAPIIDAAEELEVARTGPEDEPATLEVTAYPDRVTAETALASGEVEAVLVGDDTLLMERQPGFFGGSGLGGLLQEAAASLRVQELLRDDAAADVIEVLATEPLTIEPITGGDVDADAAMSRGVVAYGGLTLMYIAVLTYGNWTLSGVTEEKANRVVEVLLSTVRAWQLLAAKVLGIGVLGLAQFVLALTAVVAAVRLSGVAELPQVPIDSMIGLVAWFILGFGLYSVIYATAGALVSRIEEAQNVALPVTLIAIVGFFVSFRVLDDPDGAMAVVTTFIPLTAPFVAPIRLALEAIAWWEMALAAAVTVTTIVGLLRFAGRVYAGGLLHFGGRMRIRDAYRSAEL